MAFIDARLNDRYRFGFTGGPAWNTLKVDLQSGRTRRRKQWAMPHHKYTADFATLTESEKEVLLSAFMAAGGSYASFRFRDYNDFTATRQLIGSGDATDDPKQLVRNYLFGPSLYTRTITLPLEVVVRDEDDVEVPVTVDDETGLVTPVTTWPSGKALFWWGKFDVRVNFSSDYNPLTAVATGIREATIELEEDFG